MNGKLHSEPGKEPSIYSAVRRIRITLRWFIRRFKRDLRRFDATIGAATRTNTRRWFRSARDHSESELRELSDDSRLHYEKTRPKIVPLLDSAQEITESVRVILSKAVLYGLIASIVAIITVVLAWRFHSLRLTSGVVRRIGR